MFATAQKAAKGILSKTVPENIDLSTLTSQCKPRYHFSWGISNVVTALPESYFVSQLYEILEQGDAAPNKDVNSTSFFAMFCA